MPRSKLLLSITAVLFSVTFGACSRSAQGKPKSTCADAYESAQEARKASKLRSAAEMLAVCAQKTCGAFLHRECSVWLEELQHAMPSVILSVSDATGAPLDEVEVSMDGEPLTSALSGVAIAVDPGLREFRFSAKGYVALSKQVNVLEGQQKRPIEVRLAAYAKSRRVSEARQQQDRVIDEPSPGGSTKSIAPYAIGGIGVLGMVGFAALGSLAKSEHAEVRACLPDCDRAKLARVGTFYTVANISLGVGILGLGTATVLFLIPQGSSSENRRRKPSDKTTSAAIDVHRTSDGVFAELRGTF
jgi:hypothetical protein